MEEKTNLLDHVNKGDLGNFTLLLLVVSVGFYYSYDLIQRNPEVTKCHVSDCIEHTIQLGEESVHLSFECEIEKNDCEQDCLLGTEILSLRTIRRLGLEKRDQCEYVEGTFYLGLPYKPSGDLTKGLVTFVATMTALCWGVAGIFEDVKSRKDKTKAD